MRTFSKTSTRLNGKDRTNTVTVEASGSLVLIRSKDESSDMPRLDRRRSSDAERDAGRAARDLLADGYTER